jgi:hypothetical protein
MSNEVKQKDQRIAELEKQLAIKDKALELAVNEFVENLKCSKCYIVSPKCCMCRQDDEDRQLCFNCNLNHFIQQASKELKGGSDE